MHPHHEPYLLGHFLLRAGIAFSFLYPPFGIMSNPAAWVQFFPAFLQQMPVDLMTVMYGYAAFEFVLSVWILSGRHHRVAGTLAGALLIMITLVNLDDFSIVFRNVSLAFTAFAFALLPRPRMSAPRAHNQ